MSFLYQAIHKAREEIMRRFRRNKKKVESYLKIIDNRWDSQLRRNHHATGYWFNLACRFNDEEFEQHFYTTSGLLDVIENYSHGDPELQNKLTIEMRIYKDAKLDFKSQSILYERNIVIPDQWWESYGCGALNLQKLVIHVVAYSFRKKNRLEHQKLDDLVFVRYNLRKKTHQSYDPINLETLDDHSNWVMEDSPPFLTNEDVDALRNNLANMTIQPISSDIGIFFILLFHYFVFISLNLNL
uniref:HAT C-terminal dimerisation domain-containing protein n=1 Tax=Cajanus cajan TaxID=3821 RepID=A0A151RFY8_CAJCA|nr:hypothetical protein KK1_037291 [Cajanus cajan]